MPVKDSGTSGTATRLASWLTIGVRWGCTREQPMAAGPVAGLWNSSKKKKGCTKGEIKPPKKEKLADFLILNIKYLNFNFPKF